MQHKYKSLEMLPNLNDQVNTGSLTVLLRTYQKRQAVLRPLLRLARSC